jgi:hypothetical protein
MPKSQPDNLDAALTDQMRQYAPFPHTLADLVAKMRYRPGWTFSLDDIERDRGHWDLDLGRRDP